MHKLVFRFKYGPLGFSLFSKRNSLPQSGKILTHLPPWGGCLQTAQGIDGEHDKEERKWFKGE